MPALESTDTRRPVLPRRVAGWVALGTSGSVLVALAGARVAGGPVWWFHPRIPLGGDGNTIALYAGMAVLSVAWLGLWPHVRSRDCTPRQLWAAGVLWSLPLALGAPLFSHDVYSYLAQGTIAHLGLSPYHVAPAALGRLGHPAAMAAVDPFWRHATAPYGPLFLALMSGVAAAVGSHLVLGVLAVRALTVVGLVLLWVYVPRLARALGTDPARALWLTVVSPLVLFQLLAGTHNDLLMLGVMVAGVTYAVEGRPLLGIALCAVGMTIKLPAVLGAVFIAVAWVRSCDDVRARVRAAIQALAVIAVIAALVSLATGWGLDWVSGSLFQTPAKVRLAITPATNVAWTLSSVLHDLGVSAAFHQVESVTRTLAAALAGLFALVMLLRCRRDNLVWVLGMALVAVALGGPAAWPWYFTWGIVLLAATAPFQRSPAIPFALIAAAFLVKANGILALPLQSAAVVLAVYAVIGAGAWYAWSRRRAAGRAGASLGSAQSPILARPTSG